VHIQGSYAGQHFGAESRACGKRTPCHMVAQGDRKVGPWPLYSRRAIMRVKLEPLEAQSLSEEMSSTDC